ncbi:putative hydrolase [Lachnellula hyalina]|uniref:Putative hydrolase n=1 Tax=Lachnellula hyalina TaxID=1316788 RepID=A0A8H8QU66_9HELO|nr:putative hydrolase [Lachnellula hyalina]TVY22877.1 putative hydrolase [Lachnellula hyalina]
MASSSQSQPRLPTPSDFPPNLTLSINPPTTGSPVNILILLHGLGDTHTSFTTLGKSLNLPETVTISLRAPNPIPPIFTGSSTPSFHWGDDILFDESKGTIDPDGGFTTTRKVLLDLIIKDVLIEKCHYPPRNILFYGYGQGGMAALTVAASVASGDGEELEFGGVVSVGGRLPASTSSSTAGSGQGKKGKCKTPVLLCGGSRSREVTRQAVDALKERFKDVEYVKWAKEGDGMPGSREEMLPIMRFFARRLRSRAGVPEGAVEV